MAHSFVLSGSQSQSTRSFRNRRLISTVVICTLLAIIVAYVFISSGTLSSPVYIDLTGRQDMLQPAPDYWRWTSTDGYEITGFNNTSGCGFNFYEPGNTDKDNSFIKFFMAYKDNPDGNADISKKNSETKSYCSEWLNILLDIVRYQNQLLVPKDYNALQEFLDFMFRGPPPPMIPG